MAGTLYLVTNTLNGKQYVGQTIVAGNRVGHGKLITKAYNKYGKDQFTYEPVCKGIENRNTLNFMEKFWIKVMDCRIPNGYNIEHGGSKVEKIADETRALLSAQRMGNQHRLGTKQSEATRALMSAQRRNPSAEYRRRLSEAQKGRTFSAETIEKIRVGNQGKIVSEETKAKIRAARKLQVFSAETKQKLSDAAKKQWARQKGVM
jgi:group I intron endonuclease